MLIGDIPRRNARRFPTKTAIVFGDTELTWRAVDERANRLATYLLGRGLTQGDRVAVCSRNALEWPEIVFGLAKAGLVAVPVNIRLSEPEVEYVVADSGARAAIIHTDQVAALGRHLADLDVVVEIDGDATGISYAKALESWRDVQPTPSRNKWRK